MSAPQDSVGPDRLVNDMFVRAMREIEPGRSGPSASGPHRAPARPSRATTSDLSIDEVLLLHSIGWEPVDIVCGASVVSIRYGVWPWGVGEITEASVAHGQAVAGALSRVEAECAKLGGAGVVGVKTVFEIHPTHVDAVLTGTAVRPTSAAATWRGPTFASDLSARDFVLLDQAGWVPLGLAFGAAFVHAPRRGVRTAVAQKTANVELTNFTAALYAARESAMERMQSSALALGAGGVVAVQINEGPMSFARHAVGFTAWGTAVSPGRHGHQYLRPHVVVSLDDETLAFDAGSLK